jgi:hypothetical protein
VHAELDTGSYPTGIEVTDKQNRELEEHHVTRHERPRFRSFPPCIAHQMSILVAMTDDGSILLHQRRIPLWPRVVRAVIGILAVVPPAVLMTYLATQLAVEIDLNKFLAIMTILMAAIVASGAYSEYAELGDAGEVLRKAAYIFVLFAVVAAVIVAIVVRSFPERQTLLLVACWATIVPGGWILMDAKTKLVVWRKFHSGPDPTMRLDADGVAYSDAFRETFDINVPWARVTGCGIWPRGSRGRVFCVAVEPGFLDRSVVGGLPRFLPFGMKLHGSPIVISLVLSSSVDTKELDQRVRKWTGGRCGL